MWRKWRLFGGAVVRHWFFAGGGVTVAVLTYIWGQVRHLFQQEGPDIPPLAFYVGALLLILIACFLAWRDEYEARIAGSEEIAALKANPPVVFLEFTMDTLITPSVLAQINRSNGSANQLEEAQLTVRAQHGNVLNIQIQPLPFGEVDVTFDPVLDIGTTARPVRIVSRTRRTESNGAVYEGHEASIDGLVRLLISGLGVYESKQTDMSVEYGTPGRRYRTVMSFSVEYHGNGIAKVLSTLHNKTVELTPPALRQAQ